MYVDPPFRDEDDRVFQSEKKLDEQEPEFISAKVVPTSSSK